MKELMMKALWILLITLGLLNAGCATVKGWIYPEEKKTEVVKPEPMLNGEKIVRFSESNYMPSVANRQYKRMTRQRMEEESELQAQAGSMWVMEGQGAYLFAQNKSRKEGDVVSVKIDGTAQQQIVTKVNVIKKLLAQLEDEEKKAKEMQLQQQNQQNNPQTPGLAAATPARAPAAEPAAEQKKEEPINIDNVPSKIVERQPDGNYRIKGQQPFMIGKREYKVIVTGLIRPEDYNEEGISSGKLIDPQYDVVSLRRKE